jgi:predicted 2-oxoglutarate/Fe(II)-dependent dioxygenase YbiX
MLDSSGHYFEKFGFIVKPNFIDEYLCDALINEMISSSSEFSKVRIKDSQYGIDRDLRKSRWAIISDETRDLIRSHLSILEGEIKSFFKISFHEFQDLQFIIYQQNDHFKPHPDNSNEQNAPDFVKSRKISIVIFLNSSVGNLFSRELISRDFCGGELRFYGVVDEPIWNSWGIPLVPSVGMLVAFPSEIIHEVTPVINGSRFTVVTWCI